MISQANRTSKELDELIKRLRKIKIENGEKYSELSYPKLTKIIATDEEIVRRLMEKARGKKAQLKTDSRRMIK